MAPLDGNDMVRKRIGVIGDPVEHSLSPVFQQPALDSAGIPATYERWHTAAGDLAGRIDGLRLPDAIGANVTLPHKEAVARLMDDLTDTARRVGAVNTVVNRAGRLLGDNTDVHGFRRSLTEALPDVRSRPVLLLGAGGAARAILVALAELEVAAVVVANRSVDKADRLIAELGAPGAVAVGIGTADLAPRIRDYSVIVNATSVGWNTDESVLDRSLLEQLPGDALVVDLTYRPTGLLRLAVDLGLRTLDGLPMLVYQGARSFELWTGLDAPTDLMMRAANEARGVT